MDLGASRNTSRKKEVSRLNTHPAYLQIPEESRGSEGTLNETRHLMTPFHYTRHQKASCSAAPEHMKRKRSFPHTVASRLRPHDCRVPESKHCRSKQSARWWAEVEPAHRDWNTQGWELLALFVCFHLFRCLQGSGIEAFTEETSGI